MLTLLRLEGRLRVAAPGQAAVSHTVLAWEQRRAPRKEVWVDNTALRTDGMGGSKRRSLGFVASMLLYGFL